MQNESIAKRFMDYCSGFPYFPVHIHGFLLNFEKAAGELGFDLKEFLNQGKVLDLGCGVDGVLTNYLIDSGCNAVGVDSSPNSYAKNVIRSDARTLPFQDSSFRVVTSLALLTDPDFEDSSSLDQILPEVIRVLQPGGHFVLQDYGNTRSTTRPIFELGDGYFQVFQKPPQGDGNLT
ncbi:MAG: class I SAM-dependent methyltransferase [Nanoarchaeota archaeon]